MRLPDAAHFAAGLDWLAFLLTGQRESSAAIAVSNLPRSRRHVISEALAAIRGELAASARWMELKRMHKPALPARDWALDRGTTKADLENALLEIDVFPRAALLLSVFEGVPIHDAAALLDAEPGLVDKARTIGLEELTGNLARMQGWTPAASPEALLA